MGSHVTQPPFVPPLTSDYLASACRKLHLNGRLEHWGRTILSEARTVLPWNATPLLWSPPPGDALPVTLVGEDLPAGIGELIRRHSLWKTALIDGSLQCSVDDGSSAWGELRASGFRSLVLVPVTGHGDLPPVPAFLALLHPDPISPGRDLLRSLELVGRYGYSQLETLVATALGEAAAHEAESSRGRLERWMASSVDLIATFRLDGQILTMNPISERILGYAPDELVGRSILEFVAPQDAELLSGELQQVQSGRAAIQFRNRWRHKNGSLVWLESNATPDLESSVLHCIARDITQNKVQALLLEENEQRYRSLVDHNPDAVFWLDLNGQFMDANPAFERLLGYPLDEVKQLTFAPMMAHEDLARVRANFMTAANGTPVTYDATAVAKTGHRITVTATNMPILVNDEIIGVYGVVKDISHRVHIEHELRAQHDQQAAVARTGRQALVGLPLDQLLADAVDLVCTTLDLDAARITEIDPETGAHQVQAAAGWQGNILGTRIAGGLESLCGYAVTMNSPVIMADVDAETRFTPCADIRSNGLTCGISVVIEAQAGPLGTIDAFSSEARTFTDEEIHFLQSMGSTLVLAMQRQRTEDRLRWIANHDPLTNLVNRRCFMEQVKREVTASRDGLSRGAVMFLDLDHFKEVNDTLDHRAGDMLLVNVAQVLAQEMREGQTLARLGGDEFAILLPGADAAEVEEVASRVLATIRQHALLLNENPVRVTSSAGAALYPDHGTSPDELLALADMMMYRAKAEGGNQHFVYLPELDLKSSFATRRTWELRIREALEHDHFELLCQAITPLSSQPLPHFECLLRMTTPEGERISPDQFLPIAERSGLILEIDRWVVRNAIRTAARLEKEGRPAVLQVNVSGKALDDKELLVVIQQELRETGVNPVHLVFEVTETMAVTNVAAAREFILAVKAMGCKFALDDFGRGYSSFSRLKQLPFDYLKIDGNFVRDLASDSVDRHLVKAMVELGHGLGQAVIAEWVETGEALEILRQMKVDFVQGYYVGRPGACNGCRHGQACMCEDARGG